MQIVIKDGKPTVKGLPEDQTLLFFGKVNDEYLIISGPSKTYPAKETVEMWDAFVEIIQGDGSVKIHPVQHGHKYSSGGGMVEFNGVSKSEREQIFFRLQTSAKKSTFNGIPIEEVFVVL